MPVPTEAARSPMPQGYEFVRVLGGGGCGWVALARQSGLNRLVAVKTLYAGRCDADERRRLEREGRALARLRDPNIVAVYAMEDVGDDLALVIEYVDGGDLKQALEQHRLSGPELLRALTDTAAALDRAAAAGVVHRDVKPGNILITREGRAKLTDFGLARLEAAAGAFRTAGAVVIGTPLYMPPEQIMDPERESPAGDAYSFACMVYEVLCGRPPFDATDTVQLLYAHTRTAPPAPRSLAAHLHPETEAVLLAGLAKDPALRPTPGQLMAVANRHPEDWAGIVAAPQPERTPELPIAGSVPWVEPTVFRPPAPPAKRTPPPPVLVGALVGLAIALIVLLAVVL